LRALFDDFDGHLKRQGYLAPRRSADRRCFADGACARPRLGGQIVDASIVPVPKPRNSRDAPKNRAGAKIKAGETPADWEQQPAKRAHALTAR